MHASARRSVHASTTPGRLLSKELNRRSGTVARQQSNCGNLTINPPEDQPTNGGNGADGGADDGADGGQQDGQQQQRGGLPLQTLAVVGAAIAAVVLAG